RIAQSGKGTGSPQQEEREDQGRTGRIANDFSIGTGLAGGRGTDRAEDSGADYRADCQHDEVARAQGTLQATRAVRLGDQRADGLPLEKLGHHAMIARLPGIRRYPTLANTIRCTLSSSISSRGTSRAAAICSGESPRQAQCLRPPGQVEAGLGRQRHDDGRGYWKSSSICADNSVESWVVACAASAEMASRRCSISVRCGCVTG